MMSAIDAIGNSPSGISRERELSEELSAGSGTSSEVDSKQVEKAKGDIAFMRGIGLGEEVDELMAVLGEEDKEKQRISSEEEREVSLV